MIRTHAPALLLFLAVVVLWEAAVRIWSIPMYLLPSPLVVVGRVWAERALLWTDLSTTMISAVLGFCLGLLVASGLGVLFTYSRTAERALLPWAVIIRTVPIVALAPLLTIWMGFGLAPKIAIAGIASFFPMLINIHRGLVAISREVAELLRLIDAGRLQSLVHVRMFAALPYAFAGMKASSGIAVVGAIVAEFTGANRGIGTLIVTAGYQQDAPMLFAGILVSSLATVLFYYVIVAVERACLFWPDARIQ